LNIEGQQPKPDPLAERKRLTFAQAQGLEPLPVQLKRAEISQEFRAVTWSALKREFERAKQQGAYEYILGQPWFQMLQDAQVRYHHTLDDFPSGYNAVRSVRKLIEGAAWSDVLGWLEFIFKHPRCPGTFAATIDSIMTDCRLAYRVFDGQVKKGRR
jgi:hypothetical protein